VFCAVRKGLVLLLAFLLVACAVACGGGDGRMVFERAQKGLARVDALRVHLAVHTLLSVERTSTVDASEIPLERLHLVRWAKHPHRFACGHSFECARADLDVADAARELEPVLPSLPVKPSDITSATIEVRLDSRGDLHRIDLAGELHGARLEVDLRAL
jgi:hypothetical protein